MRRHSISLTRDQLNLLTCDELWEIMKAGDDTRIERAPHADSASCWDSYLERNR